MISKNGYLMFRATALVTLLLFVFNQSALALPTGWIVQSGEVTIDNSQANKLVLTASDHAIINFDSFSVAANETVQFIQPDESASVLSRVTGSLQSDFFGNVFANGELVFINPNGIHFHASANIQIAALIASTLMMDAGLYPVCFSKEYVSFRYMASCISNVDAMSAAICILADAWK